MSSLAPLRYVSGADDAEWIRASLTTFAQSVASFVPGTFEAYARVYHPWEVGDGTDAPAPTWREVTTTARASMDDATACAELIWSARARAFVRVGSAPRVMIDVLLEHLRHATTTPDACWFAEWEGFGGSAIPLRLAPTLETPHRRYHLFTGPIEGALVSYSDVSFHQQSANLWWPADHAWCVATELDHAWTYVGGSRACIDALLADARIEVVETTAAATW